MANINKLVKNKQFMWLGVIAVSAVAIIGGGMYLSDLEVGSDDAAQTQNEPAPDMTGVTPHRHANILCACEALPAAAGILFSG